MPNLVSLKTEFKQLSDSCQAQNLMRFFKTGKGEYGEGDQFLGVKVPLQRKLAAKYKDLPLSDTFALLRSGIHEHRLTAIFILVGKFRRANEEEQKEIVSLYLEHARYINNWDLVDSSAPYITGPYLLSRNRDILYKLAASADLWEKRISIMSTFTFIKAGESKDTLAIAELLLHDEHDLIHKAVGWMLRELGNRVSQPLEEKFLRKHYKAMPRTMLRYAIEKFDEEKRQMYLKR